jgi:hypothetical protein
MTLFSPVAFVYAFIALSIVAYKRLEVEDDPDAMPACGHLRGWYIAAALWPLMFVLVTVIAAAVVATTLVVEFLER